MEVFHLNSKALKKSISLIGLKKFQELEFSVIYCGRILLRMFKENAKEVFGITMLEVVRISLVLN